MMSGPPWMLLPYLLNFMRLNPISDLTLKDVLIGSPNYRGDTLIKAANLQVDFQSLWELFSNRLTVNHLSLEDAFLNVEKKSGDTLTNLDVALLLLLPAKD